MAWGNSTIANHAPRAPRLDVPLPAKVAARTHGRFAGKSGTQRLGEESLPIPRAAA